jgi:heat shock protein HtpX
VQFREEQLRNKSKTYLLLALFGALAWLVFYAGLTYFGAGTRNIIPMAVGFALLTTWGSYYFSDSLVLKMTGAKEIQESENPKLFEIVREVCSQSGLPMPKVAIVQDSAPNAFATGRKPEKALIAFTTGILDSMTKDELHGVTAHEMAHVGNRDTLVSAIAATTAGAIALLSDFIMRMMWFGGRRDSRSSNPLMLAASFIVLIMAPIAAMLLRSAISRSREALADATAVQFTRNPKGLREALEVLQANSSVVQQRSTAVAHLWIESPLDAKAVSKLFSTHPPIEERIAILRAMEREY